MSRRGMGRGLAAILPDAPAERVRAARAARGVDPSQPATSRERASAPTRSRRLAASSADAGVVQPLIVRPLRDGRYELIAGERRWRAAREAGLQTVPAIVRDEAEPERLQTALIENMAREDLNPVDEARACAALVEDLGSQQGGAGAAAGPQPPVDLEPDPPPRPSRRRARPARRGRAQRGPRPGDPPGPRQRGPPRARSRGRGARLVGPRDRAPREGRPAPAGVRRSSRTPTRRPRWPAPRRRSSRRSGTGVRVRPARRGIRAELHFEDLDQLAFARSAPGADAAR